MNIRLAVGCALVVFFLSVGIIVAFGLAQPIKATALTQAKRDLMAAPSTNTAVQTQPTTQPVQTQPAQTQPTTTSQPTTQPDQTTQQAPPPPPPPTYYYRRVTRAS